MKHLESQTDISSSPEVSHEKYASGELRLGFTALKVEGKNNHITGIINTLDAKRNEFAKREHGKRKTRGSRGGKKKKEEKNAMKQAMRQMAD